MMTSQEIGREYEKSLAKYTDAVELVSGDSISATGIQAGDQRYWASVIMTRLASLASNTLFICPGSVLNPDGLHWDFGSVASLIRGVFETVLMLHYLGLEEISHDEWRLRINVVHLHDCTERIRLFYSRDDLATVARFIPTAYELRQRIKNNPSYHTLPPALQKPLLSGDKATIFGKTEMLKRLEQAPDEDLDYYRFISNYVHNLPFGFHRTAEQQRIGTENDVDKMYKAVALGWGADWLNLASDLFRKRFADVATFGKKKFDVRVLRRSNLLSKRDTDLINHAMGVS